MQLELDVEKFEDRQEILIKEIVQTVMVKLVENGLEGQQLEDATASVAFSIASILDDTTQMQDDGIEVRPYLTFRTGEDTLVHCGENAYSYEFVMGIMRELFHTKK